MRGTSKGGLRRSITAAATVALLGGTLQILAVTPASAAIEVTQLVSADGSNNQSPGNSGSHTPAASDDGTYVAFISDGPLIAEDMNSVADVYRKNTSTGALDLVSMNTSNSGAGDGASGIEELAISNDGNIVVFGSNASDLIAGDTNEAADIFSRNMTTHVTTRVNVGGGQVSASPDMFSVTDDGTHVAFFAGDSPNIGNGRGVYIRDTLEGVTQFVGFAELGAQVAISGDGTKVAYLRSALSDSCPDGYYQLYVQDLTADVPTSYLANRLNGSSSSYCQSAGILGPNAMSRDGNIMAYWSNGDDYHGADTAQPKGVYAFNLAAFIAGDIPNETRRVSETSDGVNADADSGGVVNDLPKGAVSADGTKVAFTTQASNLNSGDGAEVGGAYVKDLSTGAVAGYSIDFNNTMMPVTNTTITPDGTAVAYAASATITDSDSNEASDVFISPVQATSTDPSPLSPANLSISSNFSTYPGFDQLNSSDVPATAIPLASADEVAGAPLRSVDLAASPLRSVPLRSVPLRSVPLRSVPLRSVTLSDLPLKQGAWEAVLATLNPNPFKGAPLQTITLDAVLNAFDAQPSATGLNSVTLGNIDLGSTPLRSVSMASLLLGSTPLRSVPVPGTAGTNFGNWCQLVQSLGYDCAALGLTADSPVLAVDLAGIPLRSVPLRSVPLRSVPLRSVDLSAAPLRSVPLRSVNLAGIPLRSVPLSEIKNTNPDGSLTATSNPGLIVDCTKVDCVNGTVGDAATTPDAILASKTLGDLFDHVDPNVLPGSLAELIEGLIDTSSYPWENLPLEGLQPYAGAGARQVTYVVGYDVVGGGASADATVVVDLPPGFRYVEGSSVRHDDSVSEPTVTNEHLQWTLPEFGDTHRTLSFDAYPGFDLGAAYPSAQVTINENTVTASEPSPIFVQESGEGAPPGCEIECPIDFGNNVAATAPVIAPNQLVVSHIANSGDIDYYRIPVPPKGTRMQINLGNRSANADFDVAMLNDTVSTPLRSVPLRSVPLRSVPLADNGVDASAANSAVSPETLNDIPVGAAPLRSVSENRSTADEFLATVSDAEPTVNASPQYYTLQVTAFNGGNSNQPYVLYVKEFAPPPAPACPGPRVFAFPGQGVPGVAPALPANLNTLFLVDKKRMGDTFGTAQAANALASLTTLSGRADLGVIGAVFPVESDAAAAAAMTAWDADPCSVEKANAAFTAVSHVVDTVRSSKPTLKNIVVVGGDDILPMARVADYTQISNESEYAASALLTTGANRGTPIAAAEATQNILTDDPLGDTDPIPWLDHKLYVPDLAVGRLVETPADMVAQVNQFIAAGGKLDPKTSLTTGYDFLTDGSQAVDSALNSRIPAASRTTLINETWAKSDQLAALFPAGSTPSSPAPPSPDVNSLNAHYDHTRSLPALGNSTADESDLVSTADIAAHPQTLNKRLLFTMGCHAGLSMPKAYTDAAAKDADWAQAYLGDNQKAAVYLANTGFGYGDTATVALSEELMKQFASRLDGSMTVGEAATFAKQAYFGQLGAYGPYDEKAMQEAAFYGLPMWKIATAVAPPAPPAPTFMPTDEGNGVKSAHVNVAPTFTPKMSKGGGTFFTADAPNASSKGLQVTQYRPIEPKLSVDVTPAPGAGLPPNTVAHGVLITGLTSHDVPGVPAVARPVIDLTANEPPPPTGDVAFPTTFQTLSSFNTPQGERHHAVFMPGQFFHDASWANAGGVQRLFDTIGADVKYSNKPDFTPPQLTDVDAELNGTQLTISLEAFDSAGAVTKVLVLVKDGSGTWTPHELTYGAGGGYYSGTFTVTGTQFEYFAQAQDDAGNVGITTNKGRYFNALPAGQQAPTPPHLVTDPGHANGEHGWYRNNVKVTLEGLQTGVTYKKSVDGGPESTYTGPIDFTTDGSHSVKVNGSDGSTAVLAVVIDKTLPTIGATPDRPANANGWYNAPVTVTFNCADAPPGSGINTCTPPVKFSNEGTNQSATGKAVDFAGNEKSVSLAGIKVDKTAPLLGIFGVRDGGKYELGKGPGPFCLTYDFLSGGATCTGVTTGGLANGVGSFTYTATAKDRAGNTITKSVSYRVVYRWDGFGSPLCSSNDDNNHHDGDDDHDYDHEGDDCDRQSVFKAGSTIPFKFQLKKHDGTVLQANSLPVFLTPVKLNKLSQSPNQDGVSDPANTTPTFTFDSGKKLYKYNWKTDKNMSGYWWRVGVMLDDGTIHTVIIGLK